jgi:hypothetical protein
MKRYLSQVFSDSSVTVAASGKIFATMFTDKILNTNESKMVITTHFLEAHHAVLLIGIGGGLRMICVEHHCSSICPRNANRVVIGTAPTQYSSVTFFVVAFTLSSVDEKT